MGRSVAAFASGGLATGRRTTHSRRFVCPTGTEKGETMWYYVVGAIVLHFALGFFVLYLTLRYAGEDGATDNRRAFVVFLWELVAPFLFFYLLDEWIMSLARRHRGS